MFSLGVTEVLSLTWHRDHSVHLCLFFIFGVKDLHPHFKMLKTIRKHKKEC